MRAWIQVRPSIYFFLIIILFSFLLETDGPSFYPARHKVRERERERNTYKYILSVLFRYIRYYNVYTYVDGSEFDYPPRRLYSGVCNDAVFHYPTAANRLARPARPVGSPPRLYVWVRVRNCSYPSRSGAVGRRNTTTTTSLFSSSHTLLGPLFFVFHFVNVCCYISFICVLLLHVVFGCSRCSTRCSCCSTDRNKM